MQLFTLNLSHKLQINLHLAYFSYICKQNGYTMACRNYDIRDAALPILPSGRVAFELCPDFAAPCNVVAVDANEVTPYQHNGRVYLAADGQALPLSDAYSIEQVRYYLDVARNMADEIAFQNSISL